MAINFPLNKSINHPLRELTGPLWVASNMELIKYPNIRLCIYNPNYRTWPHPDLTLFAQHFTRHIKHGLHILISQS